MATIVVSSCADPVRTGLTYKVEMPDWAFEEWWEESELWKRARILEWHYVTEPNYKGTYEGANTTVTIFKNGTIEGHVFSMTISELGQVLNAAEYDYQELEKGPGRPEKRVLVCTTTRERRTGSLVGRGSI